MEDEWDAYLHENIQFESLADSDFSLGGDFVFMVDDVVEYWKNNTSYPRLKMITRFVIHIMPGSGVLENDFSLSGKLLNKYRASLGSELFDMTMTLNRNFPRLYNDDNFLNSVEELEWKTAASVRPKSNYYEIPLQPKKKKKKAAPDNDENEEFFECINSLNSVLARQ